MPPTKNAVKKQIKPTPESGPQPPRSQSEANLPTPSGNISHAANPPVQSATSGIPERAGQPLGERLKVITLHRPWGYAIAYLDKRIENRGWPCPLKPGDFLAIHNGKKWDEDGADFVEQQNRAELIPNPTPETDPAGAVIAIARFAGNIKQSSDPWFFGPWGWRLEDVVLLEEPVPCRGQQGLWEVRGEALEQVASGYINALTSSPATEVNGQNPAPQPKIATPAPNHRQGYGTCWKCGSPFQIPGTDQSKCSGECGWVATEKKNRFLGVKK